MSGAAGRDPTGAAQEPLDPRLRGDDSKKAMSSPMVR